MMRVWSLVGAMMCVLALSGCGKKGDPAPAGPPDQITWPKVYPVR
jgi:predicted small lipoprotein YifL